MVDDDTYPLKQARGQGKHELSVSEAKFPSCVGSARFLTPDEMDDWLLIKVSVCVFGYACVYISYKYTCIYTHTYTCVCVYIYTYV